MKRTICLFTALLLLLLAGCGGGTGESQPPSESPDAAPSPTPVVTPTPEPTPEPSEDLGPVNPLTGVPTDSDLSGQRPVAIMLNNLRAAMPQQGNSQADIIYEVLAEGGITRMVGLYQDVSGLGNVGSIRSARLYYWELAQGHDAVFVHAGGSPEFYSIKSELGAFTADGVNGYYSSAAAGLFWRDNHRVPGHTYGYEHSVLSSGEAITAMLERQDVAEHAEDYVYEMSFAADGTPVDGQPAGTVQVPFSSYKTGVFRYDSDTGLYKVEQYGEPYIDGNDGTQIAVTNLLVLRTTCTVVDNEGRITVDLSSGEGWFACGGKIIPITWTKGGRTDQLRYFTADGQPLTLGQGKSYVCIIPTTRDITAE